MLYGANSINEMKQKLETYEVFKSKSKYEVEVYFPTKSEKPSSQTKKDQPEVYILIVVMVIVVMNKKNGLLKDMVLNVLGIMHPIVKMIQNQGIQKSVMCKIVQNRSQVEVAVV